MNIRTCIIAAVFAATVAPAAAQEPAQSLEAVKVEAVRYVVDCDNRSLPSQREVGEWTGQHNFSQVYAARQRLMAEIGRSCKKADVDQVRIVSRASPVSHGLHIAAVDARRGN